jgi:lon-related putative ATP-dependent protease
MSDTLARTRLPSDALRWSCDLCQVDADDTRQVAPVEGTIGQDRALKAIRVGLELDAPGYNVFVSGLSGTGRTTTVKRILKSLAPKCDVPLDRAFVHNFSEPESPTLINLPAGRAREFARVVEEFGQVLLQNLPGLLEDKDFVERRTEIMNRYGEAERALLKEFTDRVKEDGFGVAQVQAGPFQRPEVFPVRDGQPVPIEAVREAVAQGALTEEQGEEIHAKWEAYRAELREVIAKARDSGREMGAEIETLLQESVRILIDGDLTDIRRRFRGEEKLQAWIDDVEKEILEEVIHMPPAPSPEQMAEAWQQKIEAHVARYAVNVLLDRSGLDGCPVVVENFPTFTNLFGTIDRVPVGPGVWGADHRHIKAGSLLRADRGFLLLSARDVLSEPDVWEFLKRALRSQRLEIQVPPTSMLVAPATLKPEPIKVVVKVIMIGEPGLYDVLFRADPDFRKIFKVKADFDASMKLNDDNLRHFASVVAKIGNEENLLPIERDALGALAEAAVRDAGRRNRLSTRFNEVADIAREACFWAREDGQERVGEAHVRRAIEERADRYGLMEERLQDLMEQDVLMISTDGSRVGEINGLSVYQIGYHAFGKPTRITAATSAGGVGIINVEREARLSGGIYDKGVLIIAGWMRRMFAQDRPLSLTASLCFEQSYSGVDGDSASVAEIAALLSELAGIPIDCGLAVTGSVNQHGEVQPIGGVNEKVEGFFDLCLARGLTGRQGCVVPDRNVEDLMLRPDIVEAVAEGKFHVYAVGRVEDAIEILLGTPAGARNEDGEFAEGTVFAAVEDKLDRYYRCAEGGDGDISPALLAADQSGEAAKDGGRS